MEGQKTILIVGESNQNIDILMGFLDGYDLLLANDSHSAEEMAREETVDLILLHCEQDWDIFETCRSWKEDQITGGIPLLFIVDSSNVELIDKIYMCGGSDFISFPLIERELLSRINTHLKLRTISNRLEHLSSYDQMTRVYNRGKFFERGMQLFDTDSFNLYAMIFNIDKLRSINHRYGHPAGDRVIKAIATVLREHLTEKSVLGRIGGEEFALMIHQSSEDEAGVELNRIKSTVESLEIMAEDKSRIHFTINAGLVKCAARHKTLDMLLIDADLSASAKGDQVQTTFRS